MADLNTQPGSDIPADISAPVPSVPISDNMSNVYSQEALCGPQGALLASELEKVSEIALPVKKGAGHPFCYATVEELKIAIEEYFQKEKIWTFTGLALACGISRVTLLKYKNRNGFGKLITWAKEKVQESVEKRLYEKGMAAAGPIFGLCNNFDEWHQKQEQDVNLGGQANNPVKIEFTLVKPK